MISKEEYFFTGKLCSAFINYLYLEGIRLLDLLVLSFRACGLCVDILIFIVIVSSSSSTSYLTFRVCVFPLLESEHVDLLIPHKVTKSQSRQIVHAPQHPGGVLHSCVERHEEMPAPMECGMLNVGGGGEGL